MNHNELKSALHEKIDKMSPEKLVVLHDFFCDLDMTTPATKPVRITRSIDKAITDYIRSFGFLPHLKGYRYAQTALKIMIEEPELFNDKITALYSLVAKRHSEDDASSSRVERAIRHSLEVAYDKNPSMFDVFQKNGIPPTNSEFLYLAVDEIKADI